MHIIFPGIFLAGGRHSVRVRTYSGPRPLADLFLSLVLIISEGTMWSVEYYTVGT